VCIACSQLEKVKLALLDIRQTHNTLEQYYLDKRKQKRGEAQVQNTEESSGYVQKQLNNCIHQHQEIKR
jgi:hypothetical protein